MRRIPIEELLGKKYARLTIIGESSINKEKFIVRCDCGKEFEAAKGGVKSGNTKSCGCYKLEVATIRATKHSMYGHPLYSTWADMRKRCLNSNSSSYKDYGGRGIQIDPTWKDFAKFVKDMGDKPFSGSTLDRKNNDGNYGPTNCKWSSREEQAVNKRESLRYTYKGVDYTMRELSKFSEARGVSFGTLRDRISKGLPVELAVETPLAKVGWHPKPNDGRSLVDRVGVKKFYA